MCPVFTTLTIHQLQLGLGTPKSQDKGVPCSVCWHRPHAGRALGAQLQQLLWGQHCSTATAGLGWAAPGSQQDTPLELSCADLGAQG